MWVRLLAVGSVGVGVGALGVWLAFNYADRPEADTHRADPNGDHYSAWWDELGGAEVRSVVERLGDVARDWAKEDPVTAMDAAADAGELIGRIVQSAAITTWAEADPTAAIAWLSQQQPSSDLGPPTFAVMTGLVSDSVGEAISRLEAMPEGVRRHAELSLAQALLTPNAAFREADIDLLFDWHSTLPPNEELTTLLSLALARQKPERALAWARSLDGEPRTTAIRGVMIALATDDREHAKRLVSGMDDPDRIEAAKTVLFLEAKAEPRKAFSWALSFESQSERIELVNAAFNSWSREDPDAAVGELMDLPPGPMRDEVAGAAAFSILVERVDLAERLFKTIESAEERRLLAIMLHERFKRIDPDPKKAKFYRDEMSQP